MRFILLFDGIRYVMNLKLLYNCYHCKETILDRGYVTQGGENPYYNKYVASFFSIFYSDLFSQIQFSGPPHPPDLSKLRKAGVVI